MNIGYASRWEFVLGDKDLNVFKELEFAHSLGFKTFGLNLDRKKNRKLTVKQLKKLKVVAKKLKIKIVVRSPHHLNTSVDDSRLFKEVKNNLIIAKLIGSDRLMIHPGFLSDRLELKRGESQKLKGKKRKELKVDVEERINNLISNLKKIVKLGKKLKMKIALENNAEQYQLGSNLKEYLFVLNNVPGIYASISTGHANIHGNKVLQHINKTKNRLINLDIHDNKGKKDDHLPVGKGNINFKCIFGKVKNKKNITILIDTYTNKLVKESIDNFRVLIK